MRAEDQLARAKIVIGKQEAELKKLRRRVVDLEAQAGLVAVRDLQIEELLKRDVELGSRIRELEAENEMLKREPKQRRKASIQEQAHDNSA